MKLRMLFGPDALSTGSIGLLPRLKYLKNMAEMECRHYSNSF